MSDQLQSYYSRLGPARPLREAERALITKLVSKNPYENEVMAQLRDVTVQDMPDGGMGGLKFQKKTPDEPGFGKQIAEGAFRDKDGMPVSVTLSLDKAGCLFELDFFKADGSPLVGYPDLVDFEIVERHGQLGY